MIGSPFFSLLLYKKKSFARLVMIVPQTMDGWTEPSDTLYPWSGYAVYAEEPRVLTLQPFQNDIEETRDAGRTISNEWVLNLRLSSNHYFDYSSQVGRRELAEEDKDAYDVPALPVMDSYVAVRQKSMETVILTMNPI